MLHMVCLRIGTTGPTQTNQFSVKPVIRMHVAEFYATENFTTEVRFPWTSNTKRCGGD